MLLIRIWVHLFTCLGFAVEEGCIAMKVVMTVMTGGCFVDIFTGIEYQTVQNLLCGSLSFTTDKSAFVNVGLR